MDLASVMKNRSMSLPSGVVETLTLLIVSSISHSTHVTSAKDIIPSRQVWIRHFFVTHSESCHALALEKHFYNMSIKTSKWGLHILNSYNYHILGNTRVTRIEVTNNISWLTRIRIDYIAVDKHVNSSGCVCERSTRRLMNDTLPRNHRRKSVS